VLSSLSKVVLLKKWNQNYKLLVAYNLLNDLKKSVKTNEWDTFINESFIKSRIQVNNATASNKRNATSRV